MKFLRSLFQLRKHEVTILIYGEDVEFDRRRELRNAVIAALEQEIWNRPTTPSKPCSRASVMANEPLLSRQKVRRT